ncbi:serine acetyltransferase [Eggerthellaceae bacterium zg-1084]|uniref:Serine acetyltransferase n=1 Tax=Berryella wangjianweii TaxID=2734634 RepID=A0A6M8J7H9_9ACTN|nr:serine acetyltransferase [Berryella wangjianweii]NPD31343.1 serine acetyltransferase [Berryella wangjianweii]NPD32348.1 serine acetyltransferase [Eggerthellaceae bacterium zg-997]QKF06882.1 serine acetyltransferase [Berryella wangjianweii]
MLREDLDDTIAGILRNYDEGDVFFTRPDRHFPTRRKVIQIVKELRNVMFPRYFHDGSPLPSNLELYVGSTLDMIGDALFVQVRESLLFRDADKIDFDEAERRARAITKTFLARVPHLQSMLLKDVQAAFDGDPAAQSKEEIIFSYPGFFAITVYRIAHELYVLDVPLIPRIMTEYAHQGTGVDLNAGAEVGEYFFIDHATGVVIGETTKIGNHVKIYQGVTLGALSTRGGQKLAGVKRHPTIEDNVTIYSNASVLGGQTVVGEGSVIAGSAFVVKSVPPGSRVSVRLQEAHVRKPDQPA